MLTAIVPLFRPQLELQKLAQANTGQMRCTLSEDYLVTAACMHLCNLLQDCSDTVSAQTSLSAHGRLGV